MSKKRSSDATSMVLVRPPQPLRASRAVPVLSSGPDGARGPRSVDEKTRSIEVVAATQALAYVWDWDRWEAVPEVLLMSGCRLPESRQLVFLDAHNRASVEDVLGSFRDAAVMQWANAAGGQEPALIGRAHYSQFAEKPWQDTRDGHITDVSIGYSVNEYMWLEEGQRAVVEDVEYVGPLRIATEWTPFELSLCPIGADSNAKFREMNNRPGNAAGQNPDNSPQSHKENAMSKITGGKKTAKKRAAAPKNATDPLELDFAALRAQAVNGLRGLADDLEEGKITGEEGENLAPVDSSVTPTGARADSGEDDDEPDDETTRADENEDDEESGADSAKGEKKRKKSGSRSVPLDRDALLTAERERIAEIQGFCRHMNLPEDMEKEFILTGVGINAAKARCFDMSISNSTGKPQGFTVSTGRTEQQRFYSAASEALGLRCGHEVPENTPDNGYGLRSLSLSGLAREFLKNSGQKVGDREDTMHMVGRALTTTDLPTLLIETSRRTLVETYEQQPETWPLWCGEGSVTDFKTHTAVALDSSLELDEIKEDDEYRNGKLGESTEEYKIGTFGKSLVISRQSIINDDLSALTVLPRLYGEACSRKIGDIAYAALTSNPNMGDKYPLFGAQHSNLYAGSGGVPTVQGLGNMVTGMKTQRSKMGKPISVTPQFYIAPVALETAATQFFNTQLAGQNIIGTQANPLVYNPYGGTFFTKIFEHRLDVVSGTTVYLAGPKGRTVVVYFLNGNKEPFMEVENGFSVDGIRTKVRIDAGAKAMSWHTLARGDA
ncbi:hypothetical protein LJC48_01210 [Desulfovibrio sp. OttesenSCG-928-C06]|nr:hypothetical protein [Desulfovibrio sp. OttesenSCG-928-C06]